MTESAQRLARGRQGSDALHGSCLICGTPFTGILGTLGRGAGIRRSSQNPNLCNRCDVHVEEGRIVEVGVFFADLTGYTRLTRESGPERAHQITDAFLRRAKEIVVRWSGFVVQFAGDEIMALFNVPLGREDYRRAAVAAAGELQQAMRDLSERFGTPIQTTIGIAAGHARVGRQGSDDVRDYTAVGDVVNRAARLVAHVEPGGILVDADVFAAVRDEFPEASTERLALKGFPDPVEVVALGEGAVLEQPAAPVAPGGVRFRATMLLAAIVGAPCAGLVVLNPLIVAFGLGAAGFGTLAAFLDRPGVRVPLLAVASLAAIANLLAALRRRRRSSGEAPPPAQWIAEHGSTRMAVALSIGALAVVAFELVAHEIMH